MSQPSRRIELRVPSDLRERLESACAESGRSLNAEIVARLEASFGHEPEINPGIVLVALLDHLGLEFDETHRVVRPRGV